jgi:hypothetical protein
LEKAAIINYPKKLKTMVKTMNNEPVGTRESICKRFRCSSSPKMAAKKNFAKKINKYETANFSRYRNLKQR